MNVAIPLPSSSFLGGNSKKKFHVTEVQVTLVHMDDLQEEAKSPYDFFKDNVYQIYLGETVEKFFGGEQTEEEVTCSELRSVGRRRHV